MNPNNNTEITETVIWKGHPSRWYYWKSIFFGLLLLVVVIGLFILIGVWIRRMSWTFIVTDRRVIERKGLISQETSEIFLKNVRSIKLKQGVIERLFSVGSVGLASAAAVGDTFDVKLVCIADPVRVKEMISSRGNFSSGGE